MTSMRESNVDSKANEKVSSNNSDPQIITIEEASSILRVHRSTVSRYAMSGQLRSYLIGNRRLFKLSDLWVFFENQLDRRCVFGKEESHGNGDNPKTHS